MTIKVPIGVLQDAANTIQQYTTENADLFDQIMNMISCVENCGDWRGESVEALKDITSANQKSFRQGMEDLCAFSEFLTKYVTSITEEDLKIAQQIRNV